MVGRCIPYWNSPFLNGHSFVFGEGVSLFFFGNTEKLYSNLSNISQVTFAFFSFVEVTPPGLRNWKRDCNIYPRASGKPWGVWRVVGVRILGLQQKSKPLVWMCPLEVREWSWMKYNFCEDWFLVVFIFCLCGFSCSGCQIKDSVYYRRCDRHPWGPTWNHWF